MEDVVVKKSLTLIGPRSGAIPGVFHGPLWLYLNLPAFIIGHGNPIVVGWFWVILSIINLFIIYYVGKKLFNKQVGILAAILLSAIQASAVKSFFNPVGALMLAPIFFYTLINYLKKPKIKTLVICLFLIGLLIQFQMAFGVPMLILTAILVILNIFKHKMYTHLASFFILLIPLSTYILFELRHNFLQLTSVYRYLTGVETHGQINISLLELIRMRLNEMFVAAPGMLTNSHLYATILVLIIVGITMIKLTKPNLIFVYLYFGFWLISFLFKGPMWSYYYWPFLPILILIFCSAVTKINKLIFYPVFFIIFGIGLLNNLIDIKNYNPDYLTHDESSWQFNYQVAKSIYAENTTDFGYFIFTPDLYGYYPRYAMNYTQQEFPNIKSYPFEKKTATYLLIAPPPAYGKDPNSIWYQKNTNSDLWRSSDIKITKAPNLITTYNNDFKVEQYTLSQKEIAIPANPFLIKDLTFR